MIKNLEIYQILKNIFNEIRGDNHQFQVNCPHCQEEQGLVFPDGKFNLEINTSNNKLYFHCWRCEPKFSGSLGKLIRLFGTKIDYDLYKSYASIYGSDYYSNNDDSDEFEYSEVKLPDEMILFSNMEAGNSEHYEAYNYMINDRKISRDIILKYRLGFCISGKYAKRIIVPSYDRNGAITYFIGRSYVKNEKKKYDNPKSDKNKIIFNEGYINWDSTVYLVEGVFDAFSVPNAIPLLGKTLSTTLFNKLNELKPNIIIVLDPDAYMNCIELYQTIYTIYIGCEERVKLVKLPTKDDVDELRRNHGVEAVIKSLYTARSLTVDDYFIKKLQNPYDRSGRYNSNSKYFEWKSGSTRNNI